jgi:hypothetical protein
VVVGLSITVPPVGETAVSPGELFDSLVVAVVPLAARGTAAPPPPGLTGPVGTASFSWLQTVVGVVVGEVLDAATLVMEYEKSKLPLSVVALRAESTSCSAGPFPR